MTLALQTSPSITTDPDAIAQRRRRHLDRQRAQLRPRLAPLQHAAEPVLSSDGYYEALASIGLCQGLEVQFAGAAGRGLSHRALDALGLTLQQAWNIAAHNVASAALMTKGFHFKYRPFGPGLEIQALEDASAWLAHPFTFRILYGHAQELLDCAEPIFIAPAHGNVIIADAHEVDGWALFGQATAAFGIHAPIAATEPLLWANGFPRPYWPATRKDPRGGAHHLPAWQ